MEESLELEDAELEDSSAHPLCSLETRLSKLGEVKLDTLTSSSSTK